MANRSSCSDDGKSTTYLRHYTSTPHLHASFRSNSSTFKPKDNTSGSHSTFIQQPYHESYLPKTNFSTFASQKSSIDIRYKDDPNPYKVSNIRNGVDEAHRIRIQDPFSSRGKSQQCLSLYDEEETYNGTTPGFPGLPSTGASSICSEDTVDGHENESKKKNKFHPNPVESLYNGRAGLRSDNNINSCGASTSSKNSSHEPRNCCSFSASSTAEVEFEIPDPDYDDDLPPPLDSGEDYSSVSAGSDPDPYAVPATTNSPTIPEEIVLSTKISEEERMKIECAFRGRKTSIFVSDSLANLYCKNQSNHSSLPGRPSSTGSGNSGDSDHAEWSLQYTGVLVLLLDLGETKCRDKRKIQIVLAEMGSGLALWKDVIDNLSAYRVVQGSNSFHTMHYSVDHSKVIGFSFDDEKSATAFADKVDQLTSDFANISLSGAKGKKNKKKQKESKPKKYVRPKKSDISQPCCFHHISSINTNDKTKFSSLQLLLPPRSPIGSKVGDEGSSIVSSSVSLGPSPFIVSSSSSEISL